MSSLVSVGNNQDKRWLHITFWTIFSAAIIFLSLYKLNSWPNLFWDEGWTLDAAQNWIIHGHLGHYLDGVPITARSPVRFPVVVPIALSMKLFGIGIWQGRLPGVLFTLLSLVLVYFLSSRIYNNKVGLASVIILCFVSPYLLSTIIIGRQVLAEMPMIFYLLAGYSMVWLALNRYKLWGLGAAILFGISIHAKLQVPPFWIVSMVLGTWTAISYNQRKSAILLGEITIGSVFVAGIITLLQNIYMPGSISDPALINILFNTAVIVLSWPVRLYSLITVGLYAIAQVLSYIWVGLSLIKPSLFHPNGIEKAEIPEQINKKIIAVSLWGLGSSWFLWYLLMAMFWARYLFPPYFIGSIFFAAYLSEMSGDFNLQLFVRRASDFILFRILNLINFQALSILIASSLLIGATLKTGSMYLFLPSPDPTAAAKYLENNIPTGSRVETFESELFFLAPGIKYHYPSDLVSMQLVRKVNVDPSLVINYDPLVAHPDYLVLGPYAKGWHLYSEDLLVRSFELEATVGDYEIYKIK